MGLIILYAMYNFNFDSLGNSLDLNSLTIVTNARVTLLILCCTSWCMQCLLLIKFSRYFKLSKKRFRTFFHAFKYVLSNFNVIIVIIMNNNTWVIFLSRDSYLFRLFFTDDQSHHLLPGLD